MISRREYDLLVFAPKRFAPVGKHADGRSLRGLYRRHLVIVRHEGGADGPLSWRIAHEGERAVIEYQEANNIMPRLDL